MNHPDLALPAHTGIAPERVQALLVRERALYTQRNPHSQALAALERYGAAIGLAFQVLMATRWPTSAWAIPARCLATRPPSWPRPWRTRPGVA